MMIEKAGNLNSNRLLSITGSFALVICISFLSEQAKAESVRLAWDLDLDANAAGYNVYRSETAGGPYVRLNKYLIGSPYYLDNTAEVGRTYYYSVTSVDANEGESRYSAELKVVVGKYNRGTTVVAEAGPDLIVASGETVILSGTGWDPEGKALSYSWTQVSGTKVPITRADQSEGAFLAPIVPQEARLSFRLTVKNSDGATTTDIVQITVRKRN